MVAHGVEAMTEEITKKTANVPTQRSPQDAWSSLRTDMDRMFEGFLGGSRGGLPGLLRSGDFDMVSPSIDVRESDKEIRIEAELPGIDEKDVSVTLREGVLSIKGEKKSSREETKDEMHISERSYGSFQRSFRVPDTVDVEKVAANFDKGVLTVTMPKSAEAVQRERKIPIG
jgi:HSP20 family protein